MPDVLHEGDDIEIELLRQLGLAVDHQSVQVAAMLTQKLEDGRLGQAHSVTDVQRLQVVQLSRTRQLIQDLQGNGKVTSVTTNG